MNFEDIKKEDKELFDEAVVHPLQSFEWGEFREKTNVKVIRRGIKKAGKIEKAYQMTIHKVPGINKNVGYLPKGFLPDREFLKDVADIAKKEDCVYVQLEPNVEKEGQTKPFSPKELNLKHSFHPLFPKFTFNLDISLPEEELLKNMHHKTRYNIKVAQKHGVIVKEENSEHAFNEYLKLVEETTKRQRFYAHSEDYQKKLWETLKGKGNFLRASLLTASYDNKVLVAWMLFVFKDTLYYPYGASSNEHREVMASNLMMWEAIKFGKKLGLKNFDMWGSLGPDASPKDPWYGFHRFKEGYNPRLVEFIGDFDLVLNSYAYSILKAGDKIRWAYLRARKII